MKKVTFTLSTKFYETTNFDSITLVDGNRDFSATAKLLASMEKYGNISSGLVAKIKIGKTAYYYLLDGQHRLAACKKLGIPFSFLQIELSSMEGIIELISTINSSSEQWKTINYLRAWIIEGKQDYINYQSILNGCTWTETTTTKTGKLKVKVKNMGIESLNKLLKVSTKTFKKGDMVIQNFAKARKQVKQVISLLPYLPNGAQCLRSIVEVVTNPEYNHTAMLTEVSKETLKNTWHKDETKLLIQLRNTMLQVC